MKQSTKLTWLGTIFVILLIGVFSFQTYTNYQIKNKLAGINVDLASHEAILTNIGSNLNDLREETQAQLDIVDENFDLIDEKLQISSSQITDIKKDVADIQVLSNDFTGIIEDILPAVVSVIADRSQGSGVIISEDGYIVTNYHVINDAKKIRVLTFDNSIYTAEVIGVSKHADVTLLKIDEDKLDYLEFGDSDDIKIGERVIALGNPAGLSFSVTEGIVSALERVGPNGLAAYIQTDVPINPGNSGGPLVNIKKEIIGINNFKIGGFESLGFAIDSNHVQDVVDEIFEELAKLEADQQNT